MNSHRLFFLMLMFFLISSIPFVYAAGLGDLFKGAQQTLGGTAALTNDEIIAGLKEALEVGTEKAVALVSKPNGYYKNPDIKIPLPQSVQKVEKLLRAAGYGETVDNFELSMNRAAERAAPEAKSIFVDARITSYNVCYTKLLRTLYEVIRPLRRVTQLMSIPPLEAD